jgi:hypothetical protein
MLASNPKVRSGCQPSKAKLLLSFNEIWRREYQSIPIERLSIFDLPRLKPTVWATAGKWDFVFDKSPSAQCRRRQRCHQATSEGQIAVAPLGLIAVQSLQHPFLRLIKCVVPQIGGVGVCPPKARVNPSRCGKATKRRIVFKRLEHWRSSLNTPRYFA